MAADAGSVEHPLGEDLSTILLLFSFLVFRRSHLICNNYAYPRQNS